MKRTSPADIERFIRRLVAGFTIHPEKLGIDTEVAGGCISVQFRPAAEDTGALIGTAGRMHKSFQAVLSALAARGGWELHLAPVVEPQDKHKTVEQIGSLFGATCDEQIGSLFGATCDELFENPFGWAWDVDERRSNINLMISKSEARNVTDAELGEGLSRIFNAIGHCHGRKIYVNLERAKT
jgi:predicted RNA-binding protein YlqC (UPF0109 family)